MKYWMCSHCYAERDKGCLLCATTAPDYCHADGGDDCEWREINAREFLSAVSKELPEPEKETETEDGMSEKWEPIRGEKFWYFDCDGRVFPTMYHGYRPDLNLMAFGNMFKTEEEAKSAVEKIKALLLSLQEPVTNCNHLPEWCKVGEWGFDPNRFVYFKIKHIDGRLVDVEEQGCNYVHQRQVSAFKHFKQARLRPYNAEEMKALVGKVVETPDGEVNLITAFSKETDLIKPVVMTDCWIDADYMLENGFTIDGHLCGVLEHLNDKREWVE